MASRSAGGAVSAEPAVGPVARPGWEPGARVLRGLLIPTGDSEPVREVEVVDSSAAISELLGGVLLDDPLTWQTPAGAWVTVYLGEDRARAADNPRLSMVATRIGLTGRLFHAMARGDALLLGTSSRGLDVDVPDQVLERVSELRLDAARHPD